MKKIQLETLEKINEERKLDKETKGKVRKQTLKNFLFALAILLFFIILKLMAINLQKQVVTIIFKILSVVTFVITLVLFEVAYKKDSDNLAITSIEMFFVSIVTLLSPYILINRVNVYTSSIGVLFAIYYSIKNMIIYRNVKKEYLKEKNDITQIIKKESKDELAQEQLEKTRKEKEENVIKPKNTNSKSKTNKKIATQTTVKVEQNETATPKKRGRPRKTANTETKTETTKVTSKVTENTETIEPKRKRGRPKKVNSEE